MLLDLHSHSVSSDDSRARVDQYARWVGVIRRKGYQIDGFVLTEHRKFDFDENYSSLSEEHDVLILKGSELDTDSGHFLVYGVTEELTRRIDFAEVGLDAARLIEVARELGGVAVPAHPGRFGIGLYEYISDGSDFGGLRVVEHLNDGNRPGEQARAEQLIHKYGYLGTGGSDAHLVSSIGACMTLFDNPIRNEEDLARELKYGTFRAVRLEDTQAC